MKDVLDLLFVGGERNYGFGRLKLYGKIEEINNNELFGKFKFNTSNGEIEIKTDMAIDHTKLDGIKMRWGEIEALVGLEWSEKGAGQNIQKNIAICFIPGSKLDTKLLLKLEADGVFSQP